MPQQAYRILKPNMIYTHSHRCTGRLWRHSLQPAAQMSQEQIEEMMQQSRASAEGKGSEVEMEMQTSESSLAPECGTLLACPALVACTTLCLDLNFGGRLCLLRPLDCS